MAGGSAVAAAVAAVAVAVATGEMDSGFLAIKSRQSRVELVVRRLHPGVVVPEVGTS